METLSQKRIEDLDELSSRYGLTLLMPPVSGRLNICLYITTDDMVDLTPIHESLFSDGFSFIHKIDNEKTYIEILSVHDFS